ncbi:carbon-nitrogen family hydrolase, partial [Vibrio cholerae]|uniref:nitrilase-related carbon-nitrogen hydrolase n=1 Tax=Vibrio cholerae TaxID=666 RepID=UPI001A1BA90C
RFPVWLRNQQAEYDVLIVVANWPERRSLAWKTLLQARAIENQSYVVGVNRVGTDGNGHPYSGDSSVFGPLGETLWQHSYDPAVHTV